MTQARPLLALAACAALASGCARSTVTTQVQADGSWTRTLRFEAHSGSELEAAFLLPQGAPWSVSKAQREGTVTYVARRTVGAGETLRHDLAVKSRDSSMDGMQMVNEVAVRRVGAGRLEYREALRWRGRRPARWANPQPALVRAVQGVLPDRLANEADARSLARSLLRESWRLWFGPGDPLFAEATLLPDFATRAHRQRLAAIANAVFEEQFGTRLSAADRAAATRRIVPAFSAATRLQTRDGSPLPQDIYPITALTLAARMPGRIVATNGDVDPETGEVFWGLYSWAPALGEVILTATCETAPIAGARP